MDVATNKYFPILWLWIPLAVFAAQIISEGLLSSTQLAPIHSEGGPHETAQFFITSAGFFLAVSMLFLPQMKSDPFLYAWVGVAALGCLYAAGEEVSWGQHIWNWSTPEYWEEINDQGETNLHNISSWLDQKPRLVLEVGVLVGGIIMPLLLKYKPGFLPARFNIIYPPAQLMVMAVLALTVAVLDKVDEALDDTIIFERASEVEELYMFYFVLLYLVILRSRLVQHKG